MEPAEFPGILAPVAGDKNEAAEEARWYIDGPDEQFFWMDGLRLVTVRAGASVAWRATQWWTWKTYLCKNKEEFDAKLYAVGEAPGIILRDIRISLGRALQEPATSLTRAHIWTYLRAVIVRLQYTATGIGQRLAKNTIVWAQQLAERRVTV